jgi:hypothetical protein
MSYLVIMATHYRRSTARREGVEHSTAQRSWEICLTLFGTRKTQSKVRKKVGKRKNERRKEEKEHNF